MLSPILNITFILSYRLTDVHLEEIQKRSIFEEMTILKRELSSRSTLKSRILSSSLINRENIDIKKHLDSNQQLQIKKMKEKDAKNLINQYTKQSEDYQIQMALADEKASQKMNNKYLQSRDIVERNQEYKKRTIREKLIHRQNLRSKHREAEKIYYSQSQKKYSSKNPLSESYKFIDYSKQFKKRRRDLLQQSLQRVNNRKREYNFKENRWSTSQEKFKRKIEIKAM